ncbi:MAG: RluA family pseudouridine synthase [Acidimicrobiales bacterium]
MTERRLEESVPEALDGERVDRVVALVAAVSRREATALIETAAVLLNDRPAVKGSQRVAAGDRLQVTHLVRDERPRADAAVPLPVVYADDTVLIVDKPAGLVVHPGAGNPDGTLVAAVLARYPAVADVGDPARPGIVHRLDKGTSGLLMVALTDRAHRDLSRQLRARTVERRYRTLVAGIVEADSGTVDAPLGRSPANPATRAVVADGKPARTTYRVVRRGEIAGVGPITELTCRLETGRTHQIRAHLQAIGHPVVGDPVYGGPELGSAAPPLDRPFLHAERLGFRHPRHGDAVAWDSRLPADLAAVAGAIAEQPVAGPQRHGPGSGTLD